MIETKGINQNGGRYHLPAGDYLCRIVSTNVGTSKAGNPIIVVGVDVEAGAFGGFFKRALERLKLRFGNVTWPYEATTRVIAVDESGFLHWRLERFLSLVKESNAGFTYDPCNFDETTLVGKLVGAKFAPKPENDKGTYLAEFFATSATSVPKSTEPTTAPTPPAPSPRDDLRGEPLSKNDVAPPEYDVDQFFS